ncbi:MAG: ABC transporter permease [Deltaproteobacteria bacterium]|nr:ABC transporter permease [Deltaproteobacteria bacterium]
MEARSRSSHRLRAVRRILRNPRIVWGGLVVLILLMAAVLAPQLSPMDPLKQDLIARLKPPQGLSGKYLFGTDNLGRDILSRLLYGARISLFVGFSTVIISGAIGVVLGLFAGFYKGLTDTLLSRAADIQLSIPVIILAIVLLSILGPSVFNIILVMAVSRWMLYFRVVRGLVLSLTASPMIDAARVIGASELRIFIKHLLANVWTPVIVISTQQMAQIILLEATLSFLGVGIPPSVPSWGTMVSQGRNYIETAWWVITLPGMAIFITTLAINFVGDGLRDLLDPRRRYIKAT